MTHLGNITSFAGPPPAPAQTGGGAVWWLRTPISDFENSQFLACHTECGQQRGLKIYRWFQLTGLTAPVFD
jgi:hypothetical protein